MVGATYIYKCMLLTEVCRGELFFENEIICNIISPHTKCMVGATQFINVGFLLNIR